MTRSLPISIIGAGNCGCAFAADLASRQFDVLLYGDPNHSRNIRAIGQNGFLASESAVQGRYCPAITCDIAEAVSFSRYLIIAVPSYAHAGIIRQLAAFDLRNHVVVAINANFFALSARQLLRAKNILETNASPYASKAEDGTVLVMGVKKTLAIAALPTTVEDAVRVDLERIFPTKLEWCSNVLEVSLQANNGVIHPAPAILNTGWIETTGGDFSFYSEGISRSVGKVVEAVDRERLAIASAFGFRLQTFLEEMTNFYGDPYGTISEFAFHTTVHNATKVAPKNLTHRFVSEDVPYVLVPWYELGMNVGIEARAMRSLVEIASAINGVDYFSLGRNLKSLGLERTTREDILALVNRASWADRGELSTLAA
jgi:opine dehydrogenase